ncbi:MAG: class I SAM-dependent methyltransferase [Halieaceae bacterium]
MYCRHCNAALTTEFVDLGFSPPSNAYLLPAALSQPETWYPLRVLVCSNCWLVQTEDYAGAEQLFDADYAYFSSVSRTWMDHAERYAAMIVQRLELGPSSQVLEIASNDGYLLRNFQQRGIPCLGVEPTRSTADAARLLGIDVCEAFFGADLANTLVETGGQRDLIIGNNVYAHVPDINDFTAGMTLLLKPDGVITLEFPHLLQLMEHGQFDTIYHEHFSYLSLAAVSRIFQSQGLRVFDAEVLPTHGGSLRIYGCHKDCDRPVAESVAALLEQELAAGLQALDSYLSFQQRVNAIKDGLLEFLLEAKSKGEKVCAYGAAAKGNTLLNYAGIKRDLIHSVYDAAESKQGKYLPGSHIPILEPAQLAIDKPDWLLILPWNIAPEIVEAQQDARSWGCRFLVAVPALRILE